MKKAILLLLIVSCQVTLAQTNQNANPEKSANNSVLGSTPSIVFPNGGEKLFAGSDTTISWKGLAETATVNIGYSTDNGYKWSLIGKSLKGNSYRWTGVAKQSSDNCLMRVQKDRTLFSYPNIDEYPLVKWNPNGKNILLYGRGGINVIDPQTLSTVFTFVTGYSWNIACSPDGNMIAALISEGILTITDITTGQTVLQKKLINNCTSTGYFHAINWSPDGKYIVFSNRYQVYVYNTQTGKLNTIDGITDSHPYLCWCGDSKRIAFISKNHYSIEIWDVEKLIKIKTLTENYIPYNVFECSPDGKRIAVSTNKFQIEIWDWEKGEIVQTLTGHKKEINSLNYSPDGNFLMSTSMDKTVKIWDNDTYNLLSTFTKTNLNYSTADWSPDGKKIIYVDEEMFIKLFEFPSGKVLKVCAGHNGTISSVSWNPDNKSIISASTHDIPNYEGLGHKHLNYIKRWNTGNMEYDTTLYRKFDDDVISGVSYSPDGKYLSIVYGNSVKVYEVDGMNYYLQMNNSYGANYIPQWSPDSTKIACGVVGAGIVIHDLNTKKFLRFISYKLIEYENTYCWSNDGKYILTDSYNNTIQFWDVNTGSLYREIPLTQPKVNLTKDMTMSPDGKRIAYKGIDTICVINVNDGSLAFKFKMKYNDTPIVWSPDSKTLAISYSRIISFLDSESGKELYSICGYYSEDMCWNPKGDRIAIKSGMIIIDPLNNNEEAVSEANWSIVKPKAECSDVNIGKIAVNSVKDTVINDYILSTDFPIRIDSIVFSGTNAGTFRVADGTTPFFLPHHDSQPVEFLFSPYSVGKHTAQILVFTQTDTLRQTITGEGTGSALGVKYGSINLGLVNTGTKKDTLITGIINNPGSEAININAIRLRDDKDGEFSLLTGSGPFVLNAGASVDVGLSYSPRSAGYKSCFLEFHHSGEGSIATVTLTGVGLENPSSAGDDKQTDKKADRIVIKPNPAGDVLNIELLPDIPGEYKISIADLLGNSLKLLYSGFLTNDGKSIHADISGLAAGQYYVIVRTPVSEQVKPFVKE